jgi:hypothetical protein
MQYTLHIIDHNTGMTSYRVCDASGRLIWATRAYSTDAGRDGARERVRAWMQRTGNKVTLAPAEQRKAG